MMGATLYYDLLGAGIPMDHHESDLYVLDSPMAVSIIRQHGGGAKPFIGTDGKRWWDVPFAYLPFWKSRAGKKKKAAMFPRRNPEDIWAPLGPGKFSTEADRLLYEASLDGGADDEVSVGDGGGWYGLMAGSLADIHPGLKGTGGAIIFERSDGIVEVEYFKKAADARAEFEEIQKEFEPEGEDY
jgi:hypothetical protein